MMNMTTSVLVHLQSVSWIVHSKLCFRSSGMTVTLPAMQMMPFHTVVGLDMLWFPNWMPRYTLLFNWHSALTTHIHKHGRRYVWCLRWPLLPRCFPPLHNRIRRPEGNPQYSTCQWNMGHPKLEQTRQIQQTTSGFAHSISCIFFEDGSDNGAHGRISRFYWLRIDVGCE